MPSTHPNLRTSRLSIAAATKKHICPNISFRSNLPRSRCPSDYTPHPVSTAYTPMMDNSTIVGSAPPPPGVVPNFENPVDVLSTINLVSGILGIVLMAPFVIGRIFIKTFVMKELLLEDYLCVVAWLLATGYFLTGLFMGRHGGGNHDWEVTKDEMVGFQQALYADTIVYGPTAWTTKTTLLLIFARVFSPFRKSVCFIYIFIGVMFCYYFPVMIIKIKICTPIQALWDLSVERHCFDQTKLFWTDTVMSAVTDFVILVLPIPMVWSLQVTFKKKLRISFLLGAGGVATGASIVRLILVFQPNSFADETVSFVRFNLLGVAEIGIGVICACLPAFNVLFSRYAKELTLRQESSKSKSSSRSNPNYSGEVKLSRLKTPRSARVNNLSGMSRSHPSYIRSQTSYIEVRSPQDTMFSHSTKRDLEVERDLERGVSEGGDGGSMGMRRELSRGMLSRHTVSAGGGVGGFEGSRGREHRKVHEWMQRPYFPDDGIGRAA